MISLIISLFVCLFCCFTSQVNSYGHGGAVSSPNHTFSWAGLNKWLTSNSCTLGVLGISCLSLFHFELKFQQANSGDPHQAPQYGEKDAELFYIKKQTPV